MGNPIKIEVPAINPPREFDFTQQDFERIRELIYRHAGISLAPIKRDMVYSRLSRRLRALGLTTFGAYLARLESGDEKEWETFVNSLTTNLTSFFREEHHFEILADYLPRAAERPIAIWCAAVSTGEEAYSIAITACEAFGSSTPPVTILATDIDTSVLATAERGVYPAARIEKLGSGRRQQFFSNGAGEREGMVQVRPELQRLVKFARVNLLDDRWSVPGPFDFVFCRNVMIYFDRETQHRILRKFAPLLKKDGLFFAGHSESFLQASDVMRSLGKTVYERADREGPPRSMRRA